MVRTGRIGDRQSRVIAIGVPVETHDTSEQIKLPGFTSQDVIGVETKFIVEAVLKGEEDTKDLVLHHYRENPTATGQINSPSLAQFHPTTGQKFLLFLVQENDGRYAPASGQVDVQGLIALEGRFALWANSSPFSLNRAVEAVAGLPELLLMETREDRNSIVALYRPRTGVASPRVPPVQVAIKAYGSNAAARQELEARIRTRSTVPKKSTWHDEDLFTWPPDTVIFRKRGYVIEISALTPASERLSKKVLELLWAKLE